MGGSPLVCSALSEKVADSSATVCMYRKTSGYIPPQCTGKLSCGDGGFPFGNRGCLGIKRRANQSTHSFQNTTLYSSFSTPPKPLPSSVLPPPLSTRTEPVMAAAVATIVSGFTTQTPHCHELS